jgi:hypothetical protein
VRPAAEHLVLDHLPAVPSQGPDRARLEVGVDVRALERRDLAAAVDVAAGDRLAVAVGVLVDGLFEGRRAAAAAQVVHRFATVPSVVEAAADDADLLPEVLSDVARPELAAGAVEREAPHVAQAVRPDLRHRALLVDERVVGGDRVRAAAGGLVDVDTQDLAEPRGRALAVVVQVVRGAAIAERDVEAAVRAELDHAAVVVLVRLPDLHEDALGVRPEAPARGVRLEAREHVAARLGGGVHEEDEAVLLELRVERQAEKPLFVVRAQDLRRDVERRVGAADIGLVVEDVHAAVAFDDEEAVGAVARERDVERLLEIQIRKGVDDLEVRDRIGRAVDADRSRDALVLPCEEEQHQGRDTHLQLYALLA